MEFSDRYRQCEQAFKDPTVLTDPKNLASAVVEIHELMEAIYKDVARLESELDAILASQQNFEDAQCSIDHRHPDDHALSVQNSLIGLSLRLFREHLPSIMEGCKTGYTTTKTPADFKQHLDGLGPIVRLLQEIARPCKILLHLELDDETYISELERTLALDRDARQRILARKAGAV
jgi:hypothetical protein